MVAKEDVGARYMDLVLLDPAYTSFPVEIDWPMMLTGSNERLAWNPEGTTTSHPTILHQRKYMSIRMEAVP